MSPTLVAGRIDPIRTSYGADGLRLAAPAGQATVLLQGGQVVDWTPSGVAPVLWMPEQPVFTPGRALRGGVPICWPWFGPSSEPGKPSHGTLRQSLWQVIETACTDHETSITLAPDKAVLPPGVTVVLRVALGATLSLALGQTNAGPGAFQLSNALHTYFSVADVTAIHIEGFDGADYFDQLAPGPLKHQLGPIRFTGEIDRIYNTPTGRARLVDEAAGRTIDIESSGNGTTVVWNPWQAKAERLGDLGVDGWRRMVCIETANAKPNSVTLRPGGATDWMVVKLTVQPKK